MTTDEQQPSRFPTQLSRAVDRTSDPQTPGAPSILDDRYELRERIGHGGMGTVFRAWDSRLKREVAIKQLHPAFSTTPPLREMFQREAELMANLRHPNVVVVHDTGGWDTQPYLVMPFHEGLDLERWAGTQEGPPLSIDVVMLILGQVFDGVSAMHHAGVIHGDIKPRNILVSDPLEVILVDLGLARTMSTRVDPKNLSGTPGYLAPELIRRDEPNPRLASKLDVYSLGVTAYWLLTGQTPWGTGGAMDLILRQVEGDPPPPSTLVAGLPPGFDAPIVRALDTDPSRRPSVEHLRDALMRAAAQSKPRTSPFILIVDDDLDALMFEESVVQATVEDAEVVGVRTAEEALSLIEQRPPDLVITDLQMPGLNGVEFTATLRGQPSTASIPVIVVTGVGGAAEWQVLRGFGVECLVVKPLNPRMLGDAIRSVLDPEA